MSYFTKVALAIGLFLFAGGYELWGQLDSRYSQYMFNGLVMNPAYAGTKANLSMGAFYRNQWADIEGAPTTISVNAHSPIGQKKKVGIGIYLEHDKVGVSSITGLTSSYSYIIKTYNGVLSAGLNAGFSYVAENLTSIIADTGVADEEFMNDVSLFKPNFGAGLFYKTVNYYVGFSIPNFLENNDDKEVKRITKQYRQYLLTGGMEFFLNEMLTFRPSILVKSIPAIRPFELDLNASILLKDAIWFGATVRTREKFKPESLSVMFAYTFQQGLKFGYSYDFSLTDISGRTSGTHEALFTYDLPLQNRKTVDEWHPHF